MALLFTRLCLLACLWVWVLTQTVFVAKDYPLSGYVKQEELSAMSQVVCATQCSQRDCAFFAFDAGTCVVYDAGMDPRERDPTNGRFYVPYVGILSQRSLIDVAFGKETLPLESWGSHVSSFAVDGDSSTQYHSRTSVYAWWNVDLGDTYRIQTIEVDPYYNVLWRFKNVRIYIGNEPDLTGSFSSYTELTFYPGPAPTTTLVFPVNGALVGRYVGLQGTDNFLNLGEVRVLA